MRNTALGTGFIGAGIFLVISGAILDFAVTLRSSTVNVNVIGLIVLIVGGVTFAVGIGLVLTVLSRRNPATASTPAERDPLSSSYPPQHRAS